MREVSAPSRPEIRITVIVEIRLDRLLAAVPDRHAPPLPLDLVRAPVRLRSAARLHLRNYCIGADLIGGKPWPRTNQEGKQQRMKLAFVGGTGPEGLGLAMRMASAGHEVVIGSRSKERGEEGAAKVRDAVPKATARGEENAGAVRDADVVFLTFPYSGQQPTLEAIGGLLDGKIVCDVVAPLEFQQGIGAVAINVPGKSAAQEAAAQLPNARVVSAFQNMSAEKLMDVDQPVECDVLVSGRDAEAKQVIIGLANQIAGVRGVDAGGLSQSRYVEMITSLLINLNRKHKTQTSIKIIGLSEGGG